MGNLNIHPLGHVFEVFLLSQPPVLDQNQSMIAGCFVKESYKRCESLGWINSREWKNVGKNCLANQKICLKTTGGKDSGGKRWNKSHLVDIECYIWILRQKGINSFIFKRSFRVYLPVLGWNCRRKPQPCQKSDEVSHPKFNLSSK
jgi:hypothetical protein